MVKFIKVLVLFCLVASSVAFAAKNRNNPVLDKNQLAAPKQRLSEMDKITAEYKEHLSSLEPGLRKQVVDYRKKISKINEQKRNIFRKLPSKVQEYLVVEAQYKERLEQAAKRRMQDIKNAPVQQKAPRRLPAGRPAQSQSSTPPLPQ